MRESLWLRQRECRWPEGQRGRDNNKNKMSVFEGGGMGGQRGKASKNAVFFFLPGKRHDNKILNVQILLSRNFVVIGTQNRLQ